MILSFVETRAYQLFQNPDFLTLSESMVQMIMNRSLEVLEIKKFEAMLNWAKHKVKTKSSKVDAKVEFKCIMERLSRDLKLYRITPHELIRVRIQRDTKMYENVQAILQYNINRI